MPGHETGQIDAPPAGLSWGHYVERLVADCGGWTALGEELARRAAGTDLPEDLQSIEKGIRRLARRGNQPGGQYGRWLLRHFGVPEEIESWARWLAQYHSRFADLPCRLRLDQLRLWDRPPVSESRVAAWLHLGMASVLLRMRETDHARQQLELARRSVARAGAAAEIELALADAYLLTNDGERAAAVSRLDEAERLLAGPLPPADASCLRARLLCQRAYHLTQPPPGEQADVAGAQRLFEAIEIDPALPFVCFRRDNGLAYCAWKLGDRNAGIALARRAADHAGDGGFVRFRIMALSLEARMQDAAEAAVLRGRAENLARTLEDEDLVIRVRRPGSP